jgi:hypothetical protein
MSDRSRAPIAITATRIGRTDLGAGSVLIDDDAITVMVRAREGEKHIRMPLVSVDAVVRGSGEVSLDLRDGSRLTLVSEGADRVGHDVLLRCHALPEVTRALRAFGSSRGRRGSRATAASDQQRFFAPLLEARRKAGGAGGPAAVMAAFDAPALKQSFDEVLTAFCVERYAEVGPGRRALEAELSDLAEPLVIAVQALGDAAARATAALGDLRLWRVWSGQLRDTFEVADRVWVAIDDALDAPIWKPTA